jgi:hypothetical protein
MIASILRFREQEKHTTARRILLPFSAVMLSMNSVFAILQFYLEELAITQSQTTVLEQCSSVVILQEVLFTLPMVTNDALLVCAVLLNHNHD